MQNNFVNAPHRGGTPGVPTGSPNAALLIDFDNVTMGIRSDLTRQLKELLNSDIIRGKVAVQRAYADWRRYAQYIVPLSEASVDLIFAPAYGSSKKNATDIRLAIDALELVFTRPEIGVYILLSGDSDFSSLVLKLKEYGKYVIGVGLRESASDLLVQNCDEYFSYSSLTGLTKAGEEDTISAIDPWELVERAVSTMAEENDVMRSDRLKQVMLDLDPNFDEGELGYSKFNKFLTEAASRNRLALKKLDNGQYEVQPFEKGGAERRDDRRDDRRRGGRGRKEREPRAESRTETRAEAPREVEPRREPKPEPRAERPKQPKPQPKTRERRAEDLQHGYDLLQQAIRDLTDRPNDPARDSDIKRQILEIEAGWDESELGFTKFSRFLRQAHDAEVIDLQRTAEGYYEARLPSGVGSSGPKREHKRSEDGAGRPEKQEKREPRRERERRELRGETQATAAAEDRARPEAEVEKDVEAREPDREEKAAEAPEAETPEEKPEVISAVTAGAEESREEKQAKTEQPAGGAGKRGGYGRRGGGRRGKAEGPPPLLPGQVVGGGAPSGPEASVEKGEPETGPAEPAPEPERETRTPVESGAAAEAEPAKAESASAGSSEAEPATGEPEPDRSGAAAAEAAPASSFDPEELGLPTDEGSVIRYLSNSYQGVGQKTAEALIETFGADRVFHGLNSQPEKVREVLGSGRRTDVLLDAWERDFRRRTSAGAGDKQPVG